MVIPLITNKPGLTPGLDEELNYYSPDEMADLALQQTEISKAAMGPTFYSQPSADTIIPSGLRPGQYQNIANQMPQLYKAPSADTGMPPSKPPDEEDLRLAYAKKVLGELTAKEGFNPIGFDPINEAKHQILVEYNNRYPDGRYSSAQFQRDLQERIAHLNSKKAAAMESMKVAFDQYDKLMGWKTIPKGGAEFQPGTGKMIQNPEIQMKTPNEIVLIQQAAKGDKEAQATLDTLQQRKTEAAKAGMGARMENIDVPSLAEAVVSGRESIEGVKNAFGVPVQAIVQSDIAKRYPEFDFIKSDANKKFINTPQNLRTIGLVQATYPRVESLKDKADALANINPRAINMTLNAISKEFGKTPVIDFESMRNAIIQEVNTALSGSSTPSDYRIKLELENLPTKNSPAQLQVAINNLLNALDARLDASTGVPFPLQEVQGKIKFKNASERMKYYADVTTGGDGGNVKIPPVNKLRQGIHTKFGNGQIWTLRNGQPVQVK
jgi:hypothetical protein